MSELDSESEEYLRILCYREGAYYGKSKSSNDLKTFDPSQIPDILKSLQDIGLIRAIHPPFGGEVLYQGLTPAGRSYFIDKEAAEQKLEDQYRQHLHDNRRTVYISAAVGGVVSIIVNAIFLLIEYLV